ncbi:uncharacterized protein LOC121373981 [Gigantopelta aegis]|uniref:uncharacterized protein LOC121373981 n=1 Tax=Gigantopelta aegis TaxID=1735272 RepID=UPI001B88A3A5|nr:uncharacterized protein LOC121373981 [Gigantopelta aegis]
MDTAIQVRFVSGASRRMSVNCVLCLLSVALLGSVAGGVMDITAFEYIRKFSTPLDLGECPRREVSISTGTESRDVERQACSLKKRGEVTSLPRELNDTRNVPISTASDIIAYLGLCGGEAASFLGILYKGDCVAIQIASRLTFTDKTMVRAYVEYYRKSLDILENNWRSIEEYDHYYDGKYYLKNRSYGTLEAIIIQFRFRSRKDTAIAKKIKATSQLMSVYMEMIKREVGIPSSITIIRLSTAELKDFDLQKFRADEYKLALRHVMILESEIRHLREQIASNKIAPHLSYGLYPFKMQNNSQYRIGTSSLTWEQTCMLEVTLKQAIHIGKKAYKRCRLNRAKLCVRVRELLRTLRKTQREVHKNRSNWVEMSITEKKKVASTYTARINSYSNVMKRLARAVRKWRKTEKKLKKKKKRKNLTGLLKIKKLNKMLKGKRNVTRNQY